MLLLLLAFLLPSSASHAAEIEKVTEDERGTRLFLKAGEEGSFPPIEVPLYELKVIGELKSTEEKAPLHFLVSARPCKSCPEESGIFLIRSDGKKPVHFVHPGKILDPKSRAVLFQSRAFYGRCLSGQDKDVYVVFQSEKVDRRRYLQSSVYVAEPGKEFVHENLIERRAPKVQTTLRKVRAKTCFEVQGRNRLMLAKPLDLKPRRGLSPNEEEEEAQEEAPKENETQAELPMPDADAEPASAPGQDAPGSDQKQAEEPKS